MVGRGSTSPSLTWHPEVKKGTNLLDNNNNWEPVKSKDMWGLVVRFPYPSTHVLLEVLKSVGRTWLEALLPIFTRFSIAWHGTFIMEISSYNCLQPRIDINIKDYKLNTTKYDCCQNQDKISLIHAQNPHWQVSVPRATHLYSAVRNRDSSTLGEGRNRDWSTPPPHISDQIRSPSLSLWTRRTATSQKGL